MLAIAESKWNIGFYILIIKNKNFIVVNWVSFRTMPEDQNDKPERHTEQTVPYSSPPDNVVEQPEFSVPILEDKPVASEENNQDVKKRQNPNDSQMEVHHHGHVHHEKKWKEYVFQFFMLFLAVFCGFLAENQREHFIEGQRIKEYMRGMADDLKADTTILKSTLASLNQLVKRFDSLQQDLQSFGEEENIRAHYFMAGILVGTMDFTATKRTSEQLRNTGYYRLVGNKDLLDSLVYYDTRIRKAEDYWQTQRLQERNELMNLQTKIFDVG